MKVVAEPAQPAVTPAMPAANPESAKLWVWKTSITKRTFSQAHDILKYDMPRYSSHVFLRWYVALRVQSQYSPQSAASGSFAAIACQPLSDWKSHQAAFLKSVLFLLITTIWILGYIFYGLAFSVAWDSNRISIVANTGIFWLFFHRWSALRGFWVVYLSLWTCPWPGALVNAGASSSADTTYPKSSCRCLRWDHLHQWVQDKVAGRFVSVNMYNYILYIPCPQNQISQYSPIR